MKLDVGDIFALGVIVFVLGGIAVGAWYSYQTDSACAAIGLKERVFDRGGDACADAQDNVHFVKFDGFWHVTAKEISVGGVRAVQP